jgi:hypothetical protein
MGQELYLPPDVAGWRGGATWLMSTSVLARFQFSQYVSQRVKGNLLTSEEFRPENKDDAGEWVYLWSKKLGLWEIGDQTKTAITQYADDTFVHAKQQGAGIRGMLHLLLMSPEAQMK